MNTIELEIQQRLENHELGPIRIQWADGIIDAGIVIDCPHSNSDHPHTALVPEGVFDEEVVCPQNHHIFISHREREVYYDPQAPDGFRPIQTRRIEHVQFYDPSQGS